MNTTILRALIAAVLVATGLGAARLSPVTRAAAGLSALSDPANWMGALADRIGDVPLNQVVIPGTHDSGTSSITGRNPDPSLGGIPFSPDQFGQPGLQQRVNALDMLMGHAVLKSKFVPWGRAQDISIVQQLMAGVRYLDLRVCGGPRPDPALYICHGLYGGEMQRTVLNPIESFIRAHPKEVVILDFHHFASVGNNNTLTSAQDQRLVGELTSTFAGRLIPPGTLGANMTLNDIWGTTGRVIILYRNSLTVRSNPTFWPYGDTDIAWANTDRLATLEQRVKANLQCRCDTLNEHSSLGSRFFDLQLQMTPTTSTVIAGLIDSYLHPTQTIHPPHSLDELAASNKPVLSQLLALLTRSPAQDRPHLNVITTDFIETVPLVPLAEMLNTLPTGTLAFTGAPPNPPGFAPPVVTSATAITIQAQGQEDTGVAHLCALIGSVCAPDPSLPAVHYRVYPMPATPPPYTTVPGSTAPVTLSGPDGAYEVDYFATGALGAAEPERSRIVLLDNTGPMSIVNDNASAFTYSGTWAYGTQRDAGDYQDDLHTTTQAGASITYAFTGTAVAYIGEKNLNESRVDVYVDGVLQATVDCHAAALQAQQVLYGISGLAPGSHTIRLVNHDAALMVLDALTSW